MTEHPEEVLPEQRVGALGHSVEIRAEEPVELQEHQRDGDHREGEHHEELHDERHPREDRHAHERHTGCPHVDDRGDEVEAGRQRGDTEDLQTDHPEIHVVLRRVGLRAERGVAEPAAIRRHRPEDRHRDEDAAQQVDPVRKRVQSRKGDVTRTDLQRDQEVEERRRERHDGEEDHRRAMHREQLVVHVGRNELSIRRRQLGTEHGGLEAAEHEEEQAGDQIKRPDALVVHRGEPGPDAGSRRDGLDFGVRGRGSDGCHRCRWSAVR